MMDWLAQPRPTFLAFAWGFLTCGALEHASEGRWLLAAITCAAAVMTGTGALLLRQNGSPE